MLTDKEVNHISALARIGLDDAMRERMKKDLSSILDYVTVLQSVPTETVQPLYQVTGLTDTMRPDEHRNEFPSSPEQDALLAGQAPSAQGRLVKVKGAIKK